MGLNYLWDTNTAIYFLQRQFPPTAEQFIDGLLVNNRPVISAITEIELLSWKTENEKDLNVVSNFIQDSFVIELEQPIKLKTADIRKTLGIKLPDAIIAATASVYNLTLITRNVRDFNRVTEIKTINPFEV